MLLLALNGGEITGMYTIKSDCRFITCRTQVWEFLLDNIGTHCFGKVGSSEGHIQLCNHKSMKTSIITHDSTPCFKGSVISVRSNHKRSCHLMHHKMAALGSKYSGIVAKITNLRPCF